MNSRSSDSQKPERLYRTRWLIIVGIAFICVAGVTAVFLLARSNRSTLPKAEIQKSYVALGDSVAAGVGLKDDSDSSACNRTEQAYPKLLAKNLHYIVTNIACSGATITKGLTGGQEVNRLQVAPQLEQLFALSKPDVVSITIGANDIGWTEIIGRCYTAVCGTPEDDVQVNQSLNDMRTNLQKALNQLQQHYAGNGAPQIVVTGYYQVFPDTSPAACADLSGIDAAELAWGRKVQSNLHATIQATVSSLPSAIFAPVNFASHELCTADPWVQGLGASQPYHPTEAGQAAIARAVEAALKAAH